MPLSILLAVADAGQSSRGQLVEQLSADGHEVHQAQHSRHAVALLAGRQLDVLILGALEQPPAPLALLRELRAGTLDTRAWQELPTITLAPLLGADELDALRAYEAGSDHHLPVGAGYLHLRAVLEALARRTRGATRRVRRVGAIEIDTAAREVRVAGARVEVSAKEFALLDALATGNVRDLDGEHVSRLAASMKVRGLLTPIDVVAVDGERFALVARWRVQWGRGSVPHPAGPRAS